MRVTHILYVCITITLLSGCQQAMSPVQGTASPCTGSPLSSISDAVHENGNSCFYFLPPMVPNPDYTGIFDGSVSPVVKITGENVSATFTTQSGPGSGTVRILPENELYIVNWHTDQFALVENAVYRIQVFDGETELGYADVVAMTSNKELKNVDTDELIGLKDGRTLPIKFRIEEFEEHPAGPDETTISAMEGEVVLELPAGALTEKEEIIVKPVDEEAIPPEIEVIEGTTFEFGPDGIEFDKMVKLTLAYDEEKLLPGTDESLLALMREKDGVWKRVPGSMVDVDANTVSAFISGFSIYSVSPFPPYEIVFQSDRDGDYEIFVMNSEGLNLRQFTYNTDTDVQPAWSHDGSKITFIGDYDRSSIWEVFVINNDGTNLINLTNTLYAKEWFPVWSPDDSKIAYVTYGVDTGSIIDIIDVSTGMKYHSIYGINITHYVSWSPDGTKMAFVSGWGKKTIAVLDINTKEVTYRTSGLFRSCYYPNWSPDGSQIVFSKGTVFSNAQICLVNAEGVPDITVLPIDAMGVKPVWSPDGLQIAFERNAEIFVMNSDGTGVTNVTNNPAIDCNASWWPDGNQILFQSNRDGNYEIYLVNADGTGLDNLTNNPANDEFNFLY